VDRHVSPRIAYWTSAFEPGLEAISTEVALLRQRFPDSVTWGLSHRHWVLLSRRRGFCLNPALHLVFRAAVRVLEPAFQLNHVFGSVGDWFYLQGVRRRPTVLTLAAFTPPVDKTLLDRVDRFVVEHPSGEPYLLQLGVARDRIRLILPPVDLERFSPTAPESDPFTVLFASSPEKASWLEARGVPLLLEAAALRPRMRFRFVWRPWGTSLPQVQQWIAQRGLANVELAVGRVDNMALEYRRAHVTAAPFTRLEQCKPAPNSLIESLACGRPVVTTTTMGLAELVNEARAGAVCTADPEALVEGLDRLQADWPAYSARARQLAERCFVAERFLDGYDRLYRELLN
jgi:glycosyltransferase involved in cell wall biosynthesis